MSTQVLDTPPVAPAAKRSRASAELDDDGAPECPAAKRHCDGSTAAPPPTDNLLSEPTDAALRALSAQAGALADALLGAAPAAPMSEDETFRDIFARGLATIARLKAATAAASPPAPAETGKVATEDDASEYESKVGSDDDERESAGAAAGPTVLERAEAMLAPKTEYLAKVERQLADATAAQAVLRARRTVAAQKTSVALREQFGNATEYFREGMVSGNAAERRVEFAEAETGFMQQFGAPPSKEFVRVDDEIVAANRQIVYAKRQIARLEMLMEDPVVANYEEHLERFRVNPPHTWCCSCCGGKLRWKGPDADAEVACPECAEEDREEHEAVVCGICDCGIRFCADCVHTPMMGTEEMALLRQEDGVQCMACAFFGTAATYSDDDDSDDGTASDPGSPVSGDDE